MSMRRILVAVAWAFVLWVGAELVLGGIVGAIAGAVAVPSGGNLADGFEAGRAIGGHAGNAFRAAWGRTLFFAAIATAIVGTRRGWLPGVGRSHRRRARRS